MVARAATHVRGTVCLDTKRGKLRLCRFMDELVRILTGPIFTWLVVIVDFNSFVIIEL